jgi:Domain of unknown function (DUF5060)
MRIPQRRSIPARAQRGRMALSRSVSALVLALAILSPATALAQAPAAAVSGELKRWHKVTITLDGPSASAIGTPNPFLDLRMDVTFTHAASRTTYRVPGYFAADGDAANTSATAGTKWRAHLAPDQVGQWRYRVSFRSGPGVAVTETASPGGALAPFDGVSGSFTVTETDKKGRDFRSKGMLRYVNRHHLQFAGSGEYFLKVGSDSPENLLAYEDFDDTPNYTWEGRLGGNFRKSWKPHVADWKPGDPTWKDGKGKGLVGALNYLASKGLNSQSFLTYSVHGDDRNVSPYIDSEDRTRISVAKTAQWETVFEHMESLGIFMEFKLSEIENCWDWDAGELGPERKLYYRELIARFGHHLAFYWNIGEENDNTQAQRKAFGQYIAATDPYKHLIVVHNIGSWERLYRPLMGKASAYRGASLQIDLFDVYDVTRFLRMAADLAGAPWVIFLDETRPGPAGVALGHVNAAVARDIADPDHNEGRKGALWANIMAGGAGMNTYVGFGTDVGEKSTTSSKVDVPDLMLEDFRAYDKWWDQMRVAHEFFTANAIPFQDMSNRSELVSTGWALEGKGIIVAYFPNGPVGGNRGSATGAAYAPRFPGSRTGLGAAIDPFGAPKVKLAPGAKGGPGAAEPNPRGDRHGQASLAGPGSPSETPTIDLSAYRGAYEVRWYDPVKGGALQVGSVATLTAGSKNWVEVGRPPSDHQRDWLLLLRPSATTGSTGSR